MKNFVRSLAIPRTCAFPRLRTDGGVWRIPFFSASQDAKKVISIPLVSCATIPVGLLPQRKTAENNDGSLRYSNSYKRRD